MKGNILLYNSSARGSGQFVRSLKIASCLNTSASNAPYHIKILAGNSVIANPVPPKTEIIQLPRVYKSITGEIKSDTGQVRQKLQTRILLIKKYCESHSPSVFIVDSRPAGLNNELVDVLADHKTKGKCKNVLILRDIIDHPTIVRNNWKKNNWYDFVPKYYDQILIAGEQHHYNVEVEYGFSRFANKISYIGYVQDFRTNKINRNRKSNTEKSCKLLVTVGGGYDGESIIKNVLNAIQLGDPSFREKLFTTILLGRNSSLTPKMIYQNYKLGKSKLVVHQHVYNTIDLYSQNDLIICMGGYNTLTELKQMDKRIIVIPRSHSGKEQEIRALLLQKLSNNFSVIFERDLDEIVLFNTIQKILESNSDFVSSHLTDASPCRIATHVHDLVRARN